MKKRRLMIWLIAFVAAFSVMVVPMSALGESEAFTYSDEEANVKFVVPSGWKLESVLGEQKEQDAKFVSEKDETCMIVYNSTDLWDLSDAEKKGLKRFDLNNSSLTAHDIEEMYGSPTATFSTVTYGDREYFVGDILFSGEVLAYIENGWVYMFQFTGGDEHELHEDFESLINSVEYPYVEKPKAKWWETDNVFVLILWNLLLTMAVYCAIPVIIIISRIKLTAKKLKRLMIASGVVGFIFFTVLHGANGDFQVANISATMLWSGLGYWVLLHTSCSEDTRSKRQKRKGQEKEELKKDKVTSVEEGHEQLTSKTTKQLLGKAIPEEMLLEFCRKCGADISNDEGICHVCGEEFEHKG